MKNLFLVDFENVGNQSIIGLEFIPLDSEVHIFYTRTTPIINIGALTNDIKLQLHPVPIASQSADMHLVSYLGYLIHDLDKEGTCAIISNDNDFNNIIPFWNNKGWKNFIKASTITKSIEKIQHNEYFGISNTNSTNSYNPLAPLSITKKERFECFEKTELNNKLQHQLGVLYKDSNFINNVCKIVVKHCNDKELINSITKALSLKYPINYNEIVNCLKPLLVPYETTESKTENENSNNDNLTNRELEFDSPKKQENNILNFSNYAKLNTHVANKYTEKIHLTSAQRMSLNSYVINAFNELLYPNDLIGKLCGFFSNYYTKIKEKNFFDDLYQILQNEFPNNYEVIFSDYKNIIQNINWPQIFQMQNSELSNITEENKAQLQYVLNEIYHLDIPQHEKYMILNIVTQYANEDLKLLKIKKDLQEKKFDEQIYNFIKNIYDLFDKSSYLKNQSTWILSPNEAIATLQKNDLKNFLHASLSTSIELEQERNKYVDMICSHYGDENIWFSTFESLKIMSPNNYIRMYEIINRSFTKFCKRENSKLKKFIETSNEYNLQNVINFVTNNLCNLGYTNSETIIIADIIYEQFGNQFMFSNIYYNLNQNFENNSARWKKTLWQNIQIILRLYNSSYEQISQNTEQIILETDNKDISLLENISNKNQESLCL